MALEGVKSKYKRVMSGVPQGSILGPFFFILYINSMFKEVSNNQLLYLYADDAKLAAVIENCNDYIALQGTLNKLQDWCTTWGMNFNAKKSQVMSFGVKVKNIYNYVINDSRLEGVKVFNDLGIMVNDKLTWREHIDSITKKASQRFGFVKRCIDYNATQECKLLCYKSLIRPILEYGTIVWSCINNRLLSSVERVQRRVTKFIMNDYNCTYEHTLCQLKILPLSLRRDMLDLIFLYNNIQGTSDSNIMSLLTYNERYNRRTGDNLLLQINRTKHENNKYCFHNRVCYSWNTIPYEIRALELYASGKTVTLKIN